MAKISYWVFAFISAFLVASCVFAQSSFQEIWDQEEKNGFVAADAQFLANKHVIFVAGILNEFADIINSYFTDNINAVIALGATYSYIGPSSALSIPENAALLYEEINKIAQEVQKPIILVGHSKGAAEILHALYTHPELILNQSIERALLIQPAIGGSPLADNASGILYSAVAALFNPNMSTLCTFQAQANFDRAFELYDAKISLLAKNMSVDKKHIHEKFLPVFFILAAIPNKISALA